jgi:alkylated DNA repair dioxygenase AlkB
MSGDSTGTRVELPDGAALLIDRFIEPCSADAYLECLLAGVPWQQHEIRIFGRRVAAPRLSAWYGDPGARYCYSGLLLEPLEWLQEIAELKALVESRSSGWLRPTVSSNDDSRPCRSFGFTSNHNSSHNNIHNSSHNNIHYNSALLNLYRDGSDSMGWHSDDEPELGDRPVIASLSFGASRRFRLKHRYRSDLDPVALTLSHGSLLIMYADTQKNWKHSIPKSSKVREPRINLTFRFVQPS